MRSLFVAFASFLFTTIVLLSCETPSYPKKTFYQKQIEEKGFKIFPARAQLQFDSLDFEVLTDTLLNTVGKVGLGIKKDSQTLESVKVELQTYLENVMISTPGFGWHLIETNHWLYKDMASMYIEPLINSYDSYEGKVEQHTQTMPYTFICYKYRTTVQVMVEIKYSVHTIPFVEPDVHTIDYYVGQHVHIEDARNGKYTVTGHPTRFKALILTRTTQDLTTQQP